jgi:DNA-binding transcriptional regulator YiaG
MENNKYYSNTEPMTIMAFKNRPCSLKKTDPNFKQPTAKEVKMLRNLIGFSQAALAKLLGVTYNPAKGSTTVRKWETDESEKEHRPINYAAWRLLLVASNVITGTDLESEVSSLKTKAYNIDKR